MGADSKIEWTDHTFNPWVGCTKVSEGCQHCYAEGWAKRSGLVEWGQKADRRRTREATWRSPRKWNAAAERAGRRARVFCASLADVFDLHPSIMPWWHRDLGVLIEETPWLEWLLLTKRPENIGHCLSLMFQDGVPGNIRVGVTAENQARADERIPELLRQWSGPNLISYEPALGPIDLSPWIARLHWVIASGESGPGARPAHPDWFRSIRDQCAGRALFFMKQLIVFGGRKTPFDKWPEDLRVREFPNA